MYCPKCGTKLRYEDTCDYDNADHLNCEKCSAEWWFKNDGEYYQITEMERIDE